jgi:hypothetical protein
MKVAVVGLTPLQAQQIGLYPNLQLHFVSKGKRGDNDTALTRSDRVVIMDKNVPAHVKRKVPKSLAVYVYGAVSKLRDTLEFLSMAACAVVEAPKPQPKPKPAPAPPEATTTQEENTVAVMDTPTSRKAGGLPAVLKDMAVGDVLEFSRGPTIKSGETFKMKFWNLKSQLKKAGYVIENEFSSDLKTVTVMMVERPASAPPARVITDAEAAEAASQLPQQVLPDAESPAAKYFPEEHTHAHRRPYAEGGTAAPVDLPRAALVDRMFWQDVFLQSMRANPAADATQHVTTANTALSALKAAF